MSFEPYSKNVTIFRNYKKTGISFLVGKKNESNGISTSTGF
jgi:hypothetical protein